MSRNEYENPLYGIAYHDAEVAGYEHANPHTSEKTPTPKPLPTATPLAGLTERSDRIIAYLAGVITYEQMVNAREIGKAEADIIVAQAGNASKSQKDAGAAIKKQREAAGLQPGQTTPGAAAATPGATAPGLINGKTQAEWDAIARAYDTGSPEANYGAAPRSATPSTTAGTGSAPAVPKPPAFNSLQDLQNRGALNVSGVPVLQGQQYRKVNEVVQAPDGTWGIVDPAGRPVSGPYPNQTQANAANVYSMLGPAITSNSGASIGNMAIAGPNRPLISAGSGMDKAASLDQIIQSTNARGTQTGDFIGAAQPYQTGLKRPVDITYGAIPDYGGMRNVATGPDGVVQSYTGRVIGPDGNEMAIGVGAGGANDLQQNGLPANYINSLDPTEYASAMQAVSLLRQQNAMPDLAALQSQYANLSSGASVNPYKEALARVMAAIGKGTPTPAETYGLDITPETYAQGGSIYTTPGDFDWTPPPPIDPNTGQPYPPGWAPEWLQYIADQVNGVKHVDPALAPQYTNPSISSHAQGGSMNIREPSVIQGILSGRKYGVMGAGAGENVSNITPLGNEQQQAQAETQEQAIARLLGGGIPMAHGGGIVAPPFVDPPFVAQPFGYGASPHGGGFPNGGGPMPGVLPGEQPQPPNFSPPRPHWGPYNNFDGGPAPDSPIPYGLRHGAPNDPAATLLAGWWHLLNGSVGARSGGGGRGPRPGRPDDGPYADNRPPTPNVFADGGQIMSGESTEDHVEEWTDAEGHHHKARNKGPGAAPLPSRTPPMLGTYAGGGQVNSMGYRPTDPNVLRMLASGLNKRPPLQLPPGILG